MSGPESCPCGRYEKGEPCPLRDLSGRLDRNLTAIEETFAAVAKSLDAVGLWAELISRHIGLMPPEGPDKKN